MSPKRRLRRFFSQIPIPARSETFLLSLPESRHIKTVLRLQPGDACLVTDGKGREVRAVLESESGGCLKLRVQEEMIPCKARPEAGIRLFAPLTKADKLEFLIQKAQELGVRQFCPFEAERSLVRIDAKKESAKLARWHKIAVEAAKQSGNVSLMEILAPAGMRDLAALLSSGTPVIVFHPDFQGVSFRDWFEGFESSALEQSAALFFGPEGGFSAKEIRTFQELARINDWSLSVVRLGKTILRLETAVVGVLAAIHFLSEKEDAGNES